MADKCHFECNNRDDLKGGDRIMSGLTREIYLDGYASGEKRGEEEFLKFIK